MYTTREKSHIPLNLKNTYFSLTFAKIVLHVKLYKHINLELFSLLRLNCFIKSSSLHHLFISWIAGIFDQWDTSIKTEILSLDDISYFFSGFPIIYG